MVIACYAGVGKSTFASMYPEETLDLFSMPYKWILPEKDGEKGEFEHVKAAPYLLLNPAFPENYLAAVLDPVCFAYAAGGLWHSVHALLSADFPESGI